MIVNPQYYEWFLIVVYKMPFMVFKINENDSVNNFLLRYKYCHYNKL